MEEIAAQSIKDAELQLIGYYLCNSLDSLYKGLELYPWFLLVFSCMWTHLQPHPVSITVFIICSYYVPNVCRSLVGRNTHMLTLHKFSYPGLTRERVQGSN